MPFRAKRRRPRSRVPISGRRPSGPALESMIERGRTLVTEQPCNLPERYPRILQILGREAALQFINDLTACCALISQSSRVGAQAEGQSLRPRERHDFVKLGVLSDNVRINGAGRSCTSRATASTAKSCAPARQRAARNATAVMESMTYLTSFGIRRFRFRVGVSLVDGPMVGSRFELRGPCALVRWAQLSQHRRDRRQFANTRLPLSRRQRRVPSLLDQGRPAFGEGPFDRPPLQVVDFQFQTSLALLRDAWLWDRLSDIAPCGLSARANLLLPRANLLRVPRSGPDRLSGLR